MAEIRLEGVWKVFGKVIAVKDVTLTIKDGEFLVLLGPSGCGKTTTLRCIAGLERVDGGRIFIGDRDVTELPSGKRGIGMVFQSYAVFPHMTVFDNIAFGLKMQRVDRSQIKKRVESVAELLHIEELLKRYPAQLSGGQRQRVAVARAIVLEPEVLLMDEPLSNLDALIRLQVRADLKRLHREIGSTTVYVTHDQVEALSLGDRIAVMKDGEIVQVDDPTRVYEEPADLFVGGFIGNPPMNFLKGTVHADGDRVRVELGDLKLEPPSAIAPLLRERHGEQVIIGIRAENILIEDRPTQDGLQATVLVVEPLGSHKLLTLRACGETLKAMVRPDLKIEPNREVWLRFETEKIRWLEESTGRSLDLVPAH